MLDTLLHALENIEPMISSIVGLLTLCAAIWGVLRLTVSSRQKNKLALNASDQQKTHTKQIPWTSLFNLGLNEHSQLEELVSVRTVNVAFFCMLTLSLPWLLVSLLSTNTMLLTAINLFVFVSSLLGFALQRAGAAAAARWLLVLVTASYWLGCMLTIGARHGTEYFLAALLALPVLIFSRVHTFQLLISITFFIATFFLGLSLTIDGTPALIVDERMLSIGYHANALLLAMTIFVTVNYYKGFAASSYQMLSSQKQHDDALVAKLFPHDIAQQMVNQESSSAQWRPEATVLFASLTGFNLLYSRLPAMELVAKLDALYSQFDELVDTSHVDKVKTLGTTYVAATGIDNVTNNYMAIASCSLAMRTIVEDFATANNIPVGFRCGIATGLTITGVIGKSRPRFDIWGEALEAAAALQTIAKEGEVLINQTAYWRLKDHFEFAADESKNDSFQLKSERPQHEVVS